jgi:hypothetical protein
VQNNVRVFSGTSVDGPAREYRSINVSTPVLLIPPGKTSFEYDLSDFPLKPGKIVIRGKLKIVSCSSLFGRRGPQWLYVPIEAVREFPFK